MRPTFHRSFSLLTGLVVFGALAGTAAVASEAPSLVSPGDTDRFLVVATDCPTFSLVPARDSRGPGDLELLVYEGRASENDGEPVLTARLPEGATSWTPPGTDCLSPGRYAWTARAVGPEAAGPWAEPALFEVSPAPTRQRVARALDVLHRYLEVRDAEEVLAGGTGARPGGELDDSSSDPLPTGPTTTGARDASTEPSELQPKDAGPGPGDLLVSGEYRYSNPRVRYLQVPGSAFVSAETEHPINLVRWDGYLYLRDDSAADENFILDSSALASLDFPDGAVVTDMQCYFWDRGSPDIENASVGFYERPVGSTSADGLGGLSITTENVQSLSIGSRSRDFPDVVIDEETSQYTLRVNWRVSEPGDDARFYGCRLRYEQSRVAP